MKNARQVCSCRDVGELKFAGMDGSVLIVFVLYFVFCIYLFLQSLSNTYLELFYLVYWKERRGAHLGKLMLCPFKLHVTRDLRFLLKKKKLN